MRIWIVGLVAGCLLGWGRPAAACGEWHMTDKEKQLAISWLINSGTIAKGTKRVGALYLDDDLKHGLRVVTSRKVIFDIRAGKLRKYGTPVATLDGNAITFGKRVYTIAFDDEHGFHGMDDMRAWKVTVTRGDDVVIESESASALCAVAHARTGDPLTREEQQAELRTRIGYYLAWREVGL